MPGLKKKELRTDKDLTIKQKMFVDILVANWGEITKSNALKEAKYECKNDNDYSDIASRLTNRKLDPWQVDTWETMKKVAKDEARKTGNFGELRELRKIERKSFNKRKPKKTEPIINYQPITPPLITPEPEPVKAQEPTVKIYKDGGLGTMDRPTQLTIDAYRDLKWYNK